MILRIESMDNEWIKLYCDDRLEMSKFEYQEEQGVYQSWGKNKGWRYTKVAKKVYEGKKSRHPHYYFKPGWGMLIYQTFRNQLGPEDADKLLKSMYSTGYRTTKFPGLRDYQNDDLLHVLKYRYGIYQCYTGYGKSQVIATLVDYAYKDLQKNVLLLAPNSKAVDELKKRVKSVFDIDVPSADGRLNIINTGGVSGAKKYKDPDLLKKTQEELDKVDWILADEVEYVMSPGGCKVLDMCRNADVKYGFSGTADKSNAEMISFASGISDVIKKNKKLVDYFGQSLIYRVPIHLDINMIKLKTRCFKNLEFTEEDFGEDTNVYANIMNKMWTHPDTCWLMNELILRYPKLFIPVNNLAVVISNWIDNYWKGVFRILLVSGAGYTYYDREGNQSMVDLTGACDLIRAGEVDVIPSTSAGYRALDFPDLNNILLLQGRIAGIVLQSIGRVARGKVVNIINLWPDPYRVIPVYTKHMRERIKMISEYYKYSNLKEVDIHEDSFRTNVQSEEDSCH